MNVPKIQHQRQREDNNDDMALMMAESSASTSKHESLAGPRYLQRSKVANSNRQDYSYSQQKRVSINKQIPSQTALSQIKHSFLSTIPPFPKSIQQTKGLIYLLLGYTSEEEVSNLDEGVSGNRDEDQDEDAEEMHLRIQLEMAINAEKEDIIEIQKAKNILNTLENDPTKTTRQDHHPSSVSNTSNINESEKDDTSSKVQTLPSTNLNASPMEHSLIDNEFWTRKISSNDEPLSDLSLTDTQNETQNKKIKLSLEKMKNSSQNILDLRKKYLQYRAKKYPIAKSIHSIQKNGRWVRGRSRWWWVLCIYLMYKIPTVIQTLLFKYV